jgi:ferrous iron transport protein B
MDKRTLRVALAGNANVGKSALFNHLTGLHQHIGNWPGKTVERAEGTLHFKGHTVDVIDLPGIYSLSTFSTEELVSREYIVTEKPDVVVNVIDASTLERNLFFTVQLLELRAPLIISLNQVDLAKKKGITIDHKKLEEMLGVKVVPTVAIKGVGVHELTERIIDAAEKNLKTAPSSVEFKYGKEIEDELSKLVVLLGGVETGYPARYAAIKLLEGDDEIKKLVSKLDNKVVLYAEQVAREIEKIHGERCSAVIASERYSIANRIASEVQKVSVPESADITEKIDALTTHKVLGYVIMGAVMLSVFLGIFIFGDFFSTWLLSFFGSLKPDYGGVVMDVLWGGAVNGLFAGIALVLPYILPFYIALAILEDSGYLTRVAFLMDGAMHRIGLHGKAIIPLILGYGCNVPACMGCKIMETHRERLIAAFVVTLVPCAARTAVILGLVAAFVGIKWALALYVFDLLLIFVLGKIAFKVLPGEPTGLIMEMSSYRMPSLKVIARQTLFRLKSFVYIVFPFYIVGSIAVKLLEIANLLEPISSAMSPVTVGWLGLPAIAGVLLIFGVIRKELTLVMLATALGTTNFAAVLTPVQIVVLALVTMLYIPCLATIAALAKEFGWKKAAYITVFEVVFAIVVGGVAFRVLSFIL